MSEFMKWNKITVRIWKTMPLRFPVLIIMILIMSICIHACLVLPIVNLRHYSVYDESGLENSAMFCLNHTVFDFPMWSTVDEFPVYGELVDELSLLGEVGGVVRKIIDISSDEIDTTVELFSYSDSIVEYVDMPMVPRNALKDHRHDDIMPIVLDHRLRGQYRVGDELNILDVEGITIEVAQVVGFLNRSNDFIGMLKGGNDPRLDYLVEDHPAGMVALSVGRPSIVSIPIERNYPQGLLLLFPRSGTTYEHIDAWRASVESRGFGIINSFDELRAIDFEEIMFKRQALFYWMCLWCVILLVIGLQGFYAQLHSRIHAHLAIYRLLGMRRTRWIAQYMAAIVVPVCTSVLVGQCIGMLFYDQHVMMVVWPYLLVISLFIILSLTTPAIIANVGKLQKAPIELMREGN